MTEHDVVARGPSNDGPEAERGVDTDELPLLTRLNARGFRLVQLADTVVLYGVMVGTMFVRFGTEWPDYPVPLYLFSFAISTAIFLTTLYFGGMYEREPRLGYPPALPRAMRQTLAAGGLVALLNLAATGAARELGISTERALPMPITNLVILIVGGALLVTANRRLVHWWRYQREGPTKVFLLGSPENLRLARAHLIHESRAEVVGEASGTESLLEDVEVSEATDVLLLSGRWIDELYPDLMTAFEYRGIVVLQRVSASETMYGLERVREIGGLPFVLLRLHAMPLSRERFKRFNDLVLVAAAAPVWLPLLVLTALYVLLVAGRPILYRQERVGAQGRTFMMLKFRTMVRDAELVTGPKLADEDDPRILKGCNWVRRTRFDELPQIINVLRGEMSLVGPRPERPELTRDFERAIPGYARRHEISPGLTGLAQVQGRYHTDPEYKLGYDLQYLVNWSPVLDLEILLRTVWVVVTGRI
ncbi:MAG: exopolysaccharide biosynthesis polyprenyl glycosylphosphotransferase [Nitriliruptorales bacterium]|nr:exopolysaccharide biosynthesis polyprenyl glycosylphosphotransferase [Nitriliruptorales bacterium]